MENPSVQISGLGLISALGRGQEATLRSLRSAIPAPRPASLFSTTITHPVFEVTDLPEFPEEKASRTLRLLLLALEEALAQAGLEDPADFRVGICMGTTVASQLNDIGFYRSFRETGSAPMAPVERFLEGNLSHSVARRYGLKGPALTVVNACSSGADAVGVALSWLRSGLCDIALAGGADEMNQVPLAGFSSLGIVSPDPCRPFDRERKGLNLGEGAGVLVLESFQSAERRGKKPLGRLLGYGAAADAHHLTAPHPEGRGLRRAIHEALQEGGVETGAIGFVNAHGTATPDNDVVEGRTLGEIFGPSLRFCSTKGYTGHTLGAAGAIEAGLTVLGLLEGWVPGNAGFSMVDPKIGMEPVREAVSVNARFALSTSLAFGGNNAVLLLGAP